MRNKLVNLLAALVLASTGAAADNQADPASAFPILNSASGTLMR